MRKLFSLVAVGLISTMWVGCGLVDSPPDIQVAISAFGPLTAAGGSVPVKVEITSDSAISTVTVTVTKGTTPEPGITVSGLVVADYLGKTKATLNLLVGAGSAVTNGTYTLTVKAVAGDIEDTDTKDFVVGGGGTGTALTTSTVTLGAQGHATGSSVDLDAATPTALGATAAKAAGTAADIVYAYSEKAGSSGPVIMSPSYAKTSSGIQIFADWATPSATTFHKVTANLSTITVEEIAALYVTASASDRVVVAVNDVLVVKTSADKYVLIRMDAVSANDAGTATVFYGK